MTKSVIRCGPVRRFSTRLLADQAVGLAAAELHVRGDAAAPAGRPCETTATATSASQAPMVRHGWVALVRASRSVNDRPLPCLRSCRCASAPSHRDTPLLLPLAPCGPDDEKAIGDGAAGRRPGGGDRGQPREESGGARRGRPGDGAPARHPAGWRPSAGETPRVEGRSPRRGSDPAPTAAARATPPAGGRRPR